MSPLHSCEFVLARLAAALPHRLIPGPIEVIQAVMERRALGRQSLLEDAKDSIPGTVLWAGFVEKKMIVIGKMDMGANKVRRVMEELAGEYKGNAYNLLTKSK
ncbi:hypothetical protein K1719_018640 [Acacia pycnantha]|nr:hypothetical protein K1719_018640 [Acacia pycnantha]